MKLSVENFMKTLVVIGRHINGLLQGKRYANQLKTMEGMKRKSGDKSGERNLARLGPIDQISEFKKFLDDIFERKRWSPRVK
jgi:hypothetical protein